MASVEVSNITSTGCKVRLTGLQANYAYQRKVHWVITYKPSTNGMTLCTADKYIDAYKGEGGDYTVTGLSPNTEYTASCGVSGIVNGKELYLNSFSLDEPFYTKTATQTNTWSVVDKGSLGTITTQQDITLTIASYKVYMYAVKFAYDGYAEFYTTGDVDTYGAYSLTTGFDPSSGYPTEYEKRDNDAYDGVNFYIRDAVSANTTYYIWVSGSGGSDTGTTTFHIVPPSKPATSTVEKWSWSASNGTASATDTSAAYNAVKNKQSTKNFSHLVWNDMVDKVYKVIKAYSSSAGWDSSYASYENTKMNSAPYYLTAVKFNSLRNNIEIVGGWLKLGYRTDIGKVESGDYVYGEYFLTLADYINDCIDKL